MAFPPMSQINHADIPAFLRGQGAIGGVVINNLLTLVMIQLLCKK